MEELLKELEIEDIGYYTAEESYQIDLTSDSEWARYMTLLSNKAEEGILDELYDNNLLTEHNSSLAYIYEEKFQLNLLADFDNDSYKLVITEI